MNKLFAPFLPPWAETGLQPAFYDLESGTVLQQTARMYDKVNQLIRLFNELSEETKTTVEEYIAKFVELKDFVDDYFDNLDVQEEINNKLDDMVEDGTLQTLLANYLVICGGNAKELGCAGDGVTDDTSALQDAVDQMHTLGINKLVIPSGEFVVSGKIELPSNFELKGMKGSVIKYVGMGADEDHPNAILPIINIVGSEDLPKANVTVENITIDCTGQTFKGGRTFEAPANTNPQPASQGLRGISIEWAHNVIVKNCKIIDLYGEGIGVRRSYSVIVDGNILNDVGGGNIIADGPTGYDNFGDGIVAFSSWDIKFVNNTIINQRKYLSGNAEGYICGRSGMEFEYGLNRQGVNTPGYELFDDPSEATGLVMSNNYVYGYTKGIHLEANVKCNVTSNTIMHCNIGMVNTITGKSVIANNYFNQDDVGPAYQSGYDGYYGGIAVTEYATGETYQNVVLTGNVFDGDTTGVQIGRSYVSINNNTFRGHGTKGAIRTIKANLRGISINGNQFYNSGIDIYHTKGVSINNNAFLNESNYCILADGCSNTVVTSNELDNIVTFTGATNNASIKNNSFYARTSYTDLAYLLRIRQGNKNVLVDGNNVDLQENDTIEFLEADSAYMLRIINNNILVTAQRTDKVIYLLNGGIGVSISSNAFKGCGYKASLIESNWTITTFELENNVLDEPASFVYKQTAGGIAGQAKIEHNIGNVSFNNVPNSDAYLTGRFVSQGDIITRFSTNDSTIGKYCSQGGYYVTEEWTENTSYTANKLVKHNDYVYKCLTGGTATVAPTNTTIGNDETGADGVKWVCVSKLATLRNVVIS